MEFILYICNYLQIISLGAGYDSSFFRLNHQGLLCNDSVRYIEIDFPDVVEGKRKLIQANPACLKVVQESGKRYHLISVDLRNLSALSRKLLDADQCALSTSVPTMFVSECSITYMDHSRYLL